MLIPSSWIPSDSSSSSLPSLPFRPCSVLHPPLSIFHPPAPSTCTHRLSVFTSSTIFSLLKGGRKCSNQRYKGFSLVLFLFLRHSSFSFLFSDSLDNTTPNKQSLSLCNHVWYSFEFSGLLWFLDGISVAVSVSLCVRVRAWYYPLASRLCAYEFEVDQWLYRRTTCVRIATENRYMMCILHQVPSRRTYSQKASVSLDRNLGTSSFIPYKINTRRGYSQYECQFEERWQNETLTFQRQPSNYSNALAFYGNPNGLNSWPGAIQAEFIITHSHLLSLSHLVIYFLGRS